MTSPEQPLRIRVQAPATPQPHLLRAAIAARLERRAFPALAEDAVATQVAEAVHQRLRERGSC